MDDELNYVLDRTKFQKVIIRVFEKVGLSSYGYPENLLKLNNITLKDGTSGIKTKNYEVRSYYWGDNDNLIELHNFIDKKHNLIIDWYKYPLRGNCCNRKVELKEFKSIMDDFIVEVNNETATEENN